MSEPLQSGPPPTPPEEEPSKGFSLTIAYSLIALAIFVAMAIALFIVLPFYHRR